MIISWNLCYQFLYSFSKKIITDWIQLSQIFKLTSAVSIKFIITIILILYINLHSNKRHQTFPFFKIFYSTYKL